MKVICIDDRADENADLSHGLPPIVVGEIYTVTKYSEYSKNKYGIVERWPVYCLAERGDGLVGYDVKRFVPLSNIDEKEFERNYNKETA